MNYQGKAKTGTTGCLGRESLQKLNSCPLPPPTPIREGSYELCYLDLKVQSSLDTLSFLLCGIR